MAETPPSDLPIARTDVRRMIAEAMRARVAPPPSIERYPVIIGSNLSMAYASSTMRNALAGYRQPFVDVLAELLDHEPQAWSQMSKRVIAVAGARWEVLPCDATNPKAVEIADAYRQQFEALDDLHIVFGRLLWGLFFGITAEESILVRDGRGWMYDGFEFIHSRRLAFPNWQAYDLYVWDQGPGDAWGNNVGGQWGLRLADFPDGKFVVYRPNLRADYSTREGLGRILTTYMLLKRLVLRVGAQDFERFVRPWVIGYYSTLEEDEKNPRAADDEDIDALVSATKSLGAGSLNSAVLPDSTKVQLIEHAVKLDAEGFLKYLDGAFATTINGQSFTTTPGKTGARSASEVAERDTVRINRYDAKDFAAVWRRCNVRPWVALNFPGNESLAPYVKAHVEEAPNPVTTAAVAKTADEIGYPLDYEKLGPMLGMPMDEELAKAKSAARLEAAKNPPPRVPEVGDSPKAPTVGQQPLDDEEDEDDEPS